MSIMPPNGVYVEGGGFEAEDFLQDKNLKELGYSGRTAGCVFLEEMGRDG